MDFLWSPWRYAYVSSATGSASCVFCVSESVESDADRLILYRGQFNFVVMNLFPYTSGHLMVVPYVHVGKLTDTDPEHMDEMTALSRRAVAVLEEAYHPEGFNIGMNLGYCAGAGVRNHLHLHVVPRWCGDVNFMTTTSETRVLPEDLADSYKRLKPLFEQTLL